VTQIAAKVDNTLYTSKYLVSLRDESQYEASVLHTSCHKSEAAWQTRANFVTDLFKQTTGLQVI
jgi:hypothetical protein